MPRFSILVNIILLIILTVHAAADETVTALVGGTVIDVSDYGKSSNDIPDAVILIEGDRITAVGQRASVTIPDGAKVIDISGKYVLPGLVDGFAAVDNQSYANAYLYMGVTAVMVPAGFRRGRQMEIPDPGPTIIKLRGVGHDPGDTGAVMGSVEQLHKEDYKVILLMYGLTPDQLKQAVDKAHELGMKTIGELGFTSYKEAVEIGVDVFVHTERYSRDLVPEELAKAVAADHMGQVSREHVMRYQQFFIDITADDPGLLEYAKILGDSGVALMPTLSLDYLAFRDSSNPWEEPVASIIDPKDLHMPADRVTGKPEMEKERLERWGKLGNGMLILDTAYYNAGARYLAGSGTDMLGTMPGISLHNELELLTRVGMTPREALAAATSNFVDTFGWDDIGILEPGRKADIIVIDGNPTEDLKKLKNIAILIKDGKIIDREQLLKISSDN
jgi:hypothetical protein